MGTLTRTALVSLAAAAAATAAKSKAEEVLQPLGERLLPPPAGAKRKLGADPAGHPENMPPSELADRAQQPLTGEPLSDDEREQASAGLHWAMGMSFGLAYGLLSRRVPAVRAGRGLLAGTALFATTHASGLPLAGLQPAPSDMPRAWWVWEGGSHLVFGLVLDAVLDAGAAALDAADVG